MQNAPSALLACISVVYRKLAKIVLVGTFEVPMLRPLTVARHVLLEGIRIRMVKQAVQLVIQVNTLRIMAKQRARSVLQGHTLLGQVHQNACLALQDASKIKIPPQHMSAPHALLEKPLLG